ncbi:unnamed protein product [Cuscuta campestris]|uniref:Uncharacterized protein n=1 Tax=Cuscuta campestris TaxID=132261 RepID=A0A484L0L3_9ASTE|nr:unnamed protein product [Cuscuta campestris]
MTCYRDWYAARGRRLIRNPAHHHNEGAESSAAALAIAVNGFKKLHAILSSGCSRVVNNACLQLIQSTLQDMSRYHADVNTHLQDEDEVDDEDDDDDDDDGKGGGHGAQAYTQPGLDTQA